MCAKKTPTTSTKPNALQGITKSPVKKPAVPKQTTKAKADDSIVKSQLASATIVKDVKVSEAKPTATSNRKVTKAIVSEPKLPAAITPVKGGIKKDAKKTASRDNSADNEKVKKQPINGKTNKLKANDSDRDKLPEHKSNHIRDNKINVKNDEVKSKSNSANEQCNKSEKSSTSLKSQSVGDNVIKEKLNKKACDKPKSPQKLDTKICNKQRASKVVKKVEKEIEIKLKISNELKNLGIDMSNSNSSLAVVIQEGITSGMKTSICEMVKTKARYCNNLNSQSPQVPQVKKAPVDVKLPINKTNKESQEKATVVESKKINSELVKVIESPEKKAVVQEPSKNTPNEPEAKPAVVNNRNKISALVNAKNSNKIKSLNELKTFEAVNKSNELEASKPTKRKYVKKKKQEDATDSSKNSEATVSESAARNSDTKIDQNKSNCVSIIDSKFAENKSASKTDVGVEVSLIVKKDKIEALVVSESNCSTTKTTVSKAKQVLKAKIQLQDGSKVKKVQDEQPVVTKVDIPKIASKIKRKYVRKVKAITTSAGAKLIKPLKDAEKPIKVECEKSDANESFGAHESQKNGLIEKKVKPTAAVNLPKDDANKSPEKSTKPTTPKKDPLKIESQDKVAKAKSLKSKVPEKKPIEKPPKLSPKKQKTEIKQEADPLEMSSCESENSSNVSDSDSELSGDTFKKPKKLPIKRNLRNKSHKQIDCKRSRVASLNAIAKVHFLYENEARSTLEADITKAIENSKQSYANELSDDDDDEAEDDNKASTR